MALGFRVSPAWWPALALASPLVLPVMVARTVRFRRGQREAARRNAARLASAKPLDLPTLDGLTIDVVVEHAHEPEFLGDAAVSYLLRTERGGLLMDVGFGPERPAFEHNSQRLGLTTDDFAGLLISHLHLDHMGGMAAQRSGQVTVPADLAGTDPKPCYVPDAATAPRFDVQVVTEPGLLPNGLATTGPLARMLFFHGLLEEQAVVARLAGKGLVVLTGCGHPTVEVILAMVRKLSDEPIYAVGGGLHFPITGSRLARAGIQAQQVFGTGKPVWQRITDADLDRTIAILNDPPIERLLLSAHDTCDHALDRLRRETKAEVEVLTAGASYVL